MSSARDHDHTAGVKLERFTPGPWRVEKNADNYRVMAERDLQVVRTSWHGSIRECYPLQAESAANARLIAAAPELLAALKDAYAFISAPQRMATPKGGPKTATYRVENYNVMTASLRAAIAKALGPQTAGESSRADHSPNNLAEKAG